MLVCREHGVRDCEKCKRAAFREAMEELRDAVIEEDEEGRLFVTGK